MEMNKGSCCSKNSYGGQFVVYYGYRISWDRWKNDPICPGQMPFSSPPTLVGREGTEGGSTSLALVVVVIVDADNSSLQHKADDERTDDAAAIYITHGINISDFLHDFTSFPGYWRMLCCLVHIVVEAEEEIDRSGDDLKCHIKHLLTCFVFSAPAGAGGRRIRNRGRGKCVFQRAGLTARCRRQCP